MSLKCSPANPKRAAWLDLLGQQGYSLVHDGGHFLQFNPAAGTAWPLDLILVSADTFAKLGHGAREIEFGPVRLGVPSLDHQIALKLHVLKQQVAGRGFKELVDISSLTQANGIDLRSERIRVLCNKFGTCEIYERILAFSG